MTPARTLCVPKTRSVLIEVAKTRPARLLGALLGLRPGNQRVPPHDERPDARGARLGERTTRSERAARHSRAGPPGSQELSRGPGALRAALEASRMPPELVCQASSTESSGGGGI